MAHAVRVSSGIPCALACALLVGGFAAPRDVSAQTPRWLQLTPPANVGLHVHDSRRDREIFFDTSGLVAMPDSANVTGQRIWIGSNPVTADNGMVFYDQARDRIWAMPQVLADTVKVWTMDLAVSPQQWTLRPITSALGDTTIAVPGFALDPLRDRLVTYGGAVYAPNWGGTTNAVYTMTLAGTPHLARAIVSGTSPGPRMTPAMVYDPWRDRMVEYGGRGSGYYDETWALSLGSPMTWQPLSPSALPPSARVPGATALDSLGRRWFIVGAAVPGAPNYGSDAWYLDLSASVPAGAAAWTQVAPGPNDPQPERYGTLIPQPRFGRLLAYDGYDTWTLSLGTTPAWARLAPGALGSVRRSLGVAFVDPVLQRVYAGLGIDDGIQWRPLDSEQPWLTMSTHGPNGRYGAAAAVDVVGRHAYVFGGGDGYYSTVPSSQYGDLWSMDLDTGAWTMLTPANPPIQRTRALAVFDTEHRKFVIHGGYYMNPNMNPRWDTWLYDVVNNTWTEALPGSYGAFWGEAGIYDPLRHRLITFGGLNALNQAPTDVHVLPLSPTVGEWAVLPTHGTMPVWSNYPSDYSANGLSAAYDPVGDRMIVAGGDGPNLSVWALSLADTATWTPITAFGVPPQIAMGAALVCDPSRGRVLRVGGSQAFSGALPAGETWALYFDESTPTQLALVSADATPDQVTLRWFDGASAAASATVYRREAGADWVVLGQVWKDGSGLLTWIDHDVVAGEGYDYRLGVAGASGVTYYGQTHVVVPANGGLALAGAWPNPSTGALFATFTLQGHQPATLELLDVAGRRVFGREVGSLGPGTHQLRLDQGGARPASGLYFLRLSSAGRDLRAKVIVAR